MVWMADESVRWRTTDSVTKMTRSTIKTIQTCSECGERVLRSERFDHPHDVDFPDAYADLDDYRESTDHSDDEDENPERADGEPLDDAYVNFDGEPMELGARYNVRLSYSVEHVFTVVAPNEDEAVRQAKDMMGWSSTAVDGHLLHKDVDTITSIYADDEAAIEHDLFF